jgi:AcrR family transcriptional regulator
MRKDHPISTQTDPPQGLRERKKHKLRRTIQASALRLFETQGYERTTVEQIAAAAEISTTTFYRYFPTREDVVLIAAIQAVGTDNVMSSHRLPVRADRGSRKKRCSSRLCLRF